MRIYIKETFCSDKISKVHSKPVYDSILTSLKFLSVYVEEIESILNEVGNIWSSSDAHFHRQSYL